MIFSYSSLLVKYIDQFLLYKISAGEKNGFSFSEFSFFKSFPTIGSFLTTMLPNILIAAGIILLGYIIIAGFKIIQGGGSGEEMEKSRQTITTAIVGFFLIFTSYFILQLIEFLTGINIFHQNF